MSELFHIPESLSPREKWKRSMGARVAPATNKPGQFIAWVAGKERAFGSTESEAMKNLADKMGFVNWEVKP